MRNPLNDKKLSREAKKQVKALRIIRRNARRISRSGNPAKREPAKKAERRAALLIGAIYRREAGL